MHRPIALSVVAAGLACAVLAAQATQPPAPQQPPTFRAGTNLVRVDVSVTDKHGEPLTTLKPEDFTVTEDGVQQPIETFKFIEANGQPTDNLSLPIRSPEHAYAEAARDDVRVFVIFWDEYHIGQMQPAILGRETLLQFVQTAFGPTDLVAITDQLTPSDAIHFTRDRGELADAVRKLQGRQGVYVPARSDLEEAQLYRPGEIERLRAEVTASALEATVGFLGTIKEGRKEILFVSQGVGPVGGGMAGMMPQYDWLQELVRVANANNTAIYTMDPRGLGASSDLLMSMATETGGKAVRSNAPASQLMQMVRDASAYYLLGYVSKSPVDGKFHKIGVRVNRPDVEVHARRGYYAPSLADVERARTTAAAAEAPPDVAKALKSLVTTPSDTAGDLWVGTSPGQDGPRVTVSWIAKDAAAAPNVRIRASADDGRVFYDGALSGGTASFPAAPGVIHVRRTLLDAQGVSLGTQETTVDVPDYRAVPLAITTPIFLRATTGLELRQLSAAADPQPYPGHEFERTDRVLVRFAVVGAAAPEAKVTVRLLSRGGAPLAPLPFAPWPGAAGTYQLDFPMGAVARGEYLIELAATHGADRVRALAPFRVR